MKIYTPCHIFSSFNRSSAQCGKIALRSRSSNFNCSRFKIVHSSFRANPRFRHFGVKCRNHLETVSTFSTNVLQWSISLDLPQKEKFHINDVSSSIRRFLHSIFNYFPPHLNLKLGGVKFLYETNI